MKIHGNVNVLYDTIKKVNENQCGDKRSIKTAVNIIEIIWEKIKDWFSGGWSRENYKIIEDLMCTHERNIELKLIAYEKFKNTIDLGYQSLFTCEIYNGRVLIYVEIDSKRVCIYDHEYNENMQLPTTEFKASAGQGNVFLSNDANKILKYVTESEVLGYELANKNISDEFICNNRLIYDGWKMRGDGVEQKEKRIIELYKVGSGISHADNSLIYDFKMGEKTCDIDELISNQGYSYIRAANKYIRHEFLNYFTSTPSQYYRLEGENSNDKKLGRNDTISVFYEMLKNLPEEFVDIFVSDLSNKLTNLSLCLEHSDVTFVGSSILIVPPRYAKEDYSGHKKTYESPELKMVDFAHPIQKGAPRLEQQSNSIIRGINNMINHLKCARELLCFGKLPELMMD